MEPSAWDPEGIEVVLDRDGQLSDESAARGVDLRGLYKLLVAARKLDFRLARASLPMYASSAGEEAPLCLVGRLAEPEDAIWTGPRDLPLALARGVDYGTIVRLCLGRGTPEEGGRHRPGLVAHAALHLHPATEALGINLVLAAGQAHAQKLAREGAITWAVFGEGVTTTGAFHEAIALAVSAELPLVMVCKSQAWPEGAPPEAGILGDSVAERVRAAGMWVRRVDGADVVGVHQALARAIDRARGGAGPALVEVVVTQLIHDPPPHRDPIERLRRHLDRTGQWTQTFQDVLEAEARSLIERAFAAAEAGDA
jgi:TPP-dependent pyruvate/acetoin dehydrogenase alpha subunit